MDDFPWGALLGALAAVAVAAIPIVISLGRESRLERVAKLLTTVSEAAPNSLAQRSVRELLNLQAARAYGRAEVGGLQWWTAVLILSIVILALQLSGLYEPSLASTTPWVLNAVFCTAALITRTIKYNSLVAARRGTQDDAAALPASAASSSSS